MAMITIKGEREGLVLSVSNGGTETAALDATLRTYLETQADFFRGADVTLDLGEYPASRSELEVLLDILREFDLHPVAFRGHDEGARTAARELGLDLPLHVSNADRTMKESVPEDSAPAFISRRTLRSGQSIRYPGSVVIIGDVNPAAEIVAGGDVVVWGALRGMVHAGASGDDTAVVCALDFSPTQLRIGQYIARPPDERSTTHLLRHLLSRLRRGSPPRPEVARVQDGVIVVNNALCGP